MPRLEDKKEPLPEEIQDRFVRVAAKFRFTHPDVTHDEIVDFMADIIGIYDDYINNLVEGNYGTPTR